MEVPAAVEPLSREEQYLLLTLRSLELSLKASFAKLQQKDAPPVPTPPATPPLRVPRTSIRAEKVDVFVRAVFLKLGEVDTVNEKFNADIYVQARWREPALDRDPRHTGAEGAELPSWGSYWNPKLHIENVRGELKETTWYSVDYTPAGRATVFQRRRIRGMFTEKMELNEYPFDTQDLTIMVYSKHGEAEVRLLADPVQISSINTDSFVDAQEWKLHQHVTARACTTSNMFQAAKKKHPAIGISCRVSRRSKYYIWNVIIIMIFLSSLVFTTWTIDQSHVENRLQLSFILLLSNITFKFTVSQTLPKVSYLTMLDKYIILSGGQLCLVCVWHAIAASLLYDRELAEVADKWALYFQGACYILFNLLFFLHGRIIISRRQRSFRSKEKRHMKKLKAMEEILDARGKI